MPKLRKTDREKKDGAMVAIIRRQMFIKRLTTADVTRLVGISNPTFSRRMHSPEDFTIKELRRICKHFDVDPAELLSVL